VGVPRRRAVFGGEAERTACVSGECKDVMPLPRRVTLEHEAGHCVVARMGRGSVKWIELKPMRTQTGISLGRAEWAWGHGGQYTLIAGCLAGPVQTGIAAERLGLGSFHMGPALEMEAREVAESLRGMGRTTITAEALQGEMLKHAGTLRSYLEKPEVQQALQVIADAIADAEAAGSARVVWADVEGLVDWTELPALPSLYPEQQQEPARGG